MSDAAFMAVAPEVAIPLEIGKQLAPHAPTILMLPLVGFAILLIIIGLIVFSVAKSKVPGILLTLLGFLVGGGAFLVMYKTESRRRRAV